MIREDSKIQAKGLEVEKEDQIVDSMMHDYQ